jgi:hypothetical protein
MANVKCRFDGLKAPSQPRGKMQNHKGTRPRANAGAIGADPEDTPACEPEIRSQVHCEAGTSQRGLAELAPGGGGLLFGSQEEEAVHDDVAVGVFVGDGDGGFLSGGEGEFSEGVAAFSFLFVHGHGLGG